jgi:hypothetical protein
LYYSTVGSRDKKKEKKLSIIHLRHLRQGNARAAVGGARQGQGGNAELHGSAGGFAARCRLWWCQRCALGVSRKLKPSTRNPKLQTLNPQSSTLNPQPSVLHPQPSTRNPKPETRHPKPETINPKLPTLNRGP